VHNKIWRHKNFGGTCLRMLFRGYGSACTKLKRSELMVVLQLLSRKFSPKKFCLNDDDIAKCICPVGHMLMLFTFVVAKTAHARLLVLAAKMSIAEEQPGWYSFEGFVTTKPRIKVPFVVILGDWRPTCKFERNKTINEIRFPSQMTRSTSQSQLSIDASAERVIANALWS